MAMTSISEVLERYEQVQYKRATGGINSLSGFNYQLRLYLAELVESLATGGEDMRQAGQAFIEALSDIARYEGDNLILIQAKKTLTAEKLKEAAEEIQVVDGFLAQHYPTMRDTVKFRLIASGGNATITWANLKSDHHTKPLIDKLLASGRLEQPIIEADPWWRLIVAVWSRLSDPYGFARYALDKALSRNLSKHNAQDLRDDICERYRSALNKAIPYGNLLKPTDFSLTLTLSKKLDVGAQVNLNRFKDGQYMPRDRRVSELHAEVTQLSQQPGQDSIPVYWLHGSSGAGKSVLLVQLLEKLVQEGRRVLWLGSKSEQLEPVLKAIHHLPEDLQPEFIAVDDLYDYSARDGLKISSLAEFIDECGVHTWPLLLTCGPADFAEDFEKASLFQGFKLHRKEVRLVAHDEAGQFAHWYRQRTGRTGQPAEAFDEAQAGHGLFVSMAVEFELGKFESFAQRFAERVKQRQLDHALRLPLALNRLYMRTPYAWLSDEDRERLYDLTEAEKDFTIDTGEEGDEDGAIRLTHPHLSDAIYRALLPDANPTAYANDLAKAFQRALQESRGSVSGQLLRLFTTERKDIAGKRLSSVNEPELAKQCCNAWLSHCDPSALDADTAADFATSWACWAKQQELVGQKLGAGLFQHAIDTLEQAMAVWPGSWQRLWQTYPGDQTLLNWAITQLPQTDRMRHSQWSYVWEKGFLHAINSTSDNQPWQDMALVWLQKPIVRRDWHFVWKHLLSLSASRQAQQNQPIVELALNRLQQYPDAPEWAFVLQDLLKQCHLLPEGADSRQLVKLGWEWLDGREERPDWSHVWRDLLEHQQLLPEGTDSRQLIKLGWDWLDGREERPDWSHVWRALLEHQQLLSEGVDSRQLVKLGWDWLDGRVDRPDWSYVWRALLEHQQLLPEGADSRQLVKRGWEWLDEREDRPDWNYVWQALLEHQQLLPEGADSRQLVKLGWEWLDEREERPDWSHVWRALLEHQQLLPEGADSRQLIKLGWHWLDGREERPDWSYVWRALLEHQQLLPEGVDSKQLVKRGWEWLDGRGDRLDWTHVWQVLQQQQASLPLKFTALRLLKSGWDWLNQHRTAKDWPVIWTEFAKLKTLKKSRQHTLLTLANVWLEKNLDMNVGSAGRIVEGGLDLGFHDPDFLAHTIRWLEKNKRHPSWPDTAAKFILAYSTSDHVEKITWELMQQIETNPNKPAWTRIEKRLKLFIHSMRNEHPSIVALWKKLHPTPLEIGKIYTGKVSEFRIYGILVRIDGQRGLLHKNHYPQEQGWASLYRIGDPIDVRVRSISDRGVELDLVGIFPDCT